MSISCDIFLFCTDAASGSAALLVVEELDLLRGNLDDAGLAFLRILVFEPAGLMIPVAGSLKSTIGSVCCQTVAPHVPWMNLAQKTTLSEQ